MTGCLVHTVGDLAAALFWLVFAATLIAGVVATELHGRRRRHAAARRRYPLAGHHLVGEHGPELLPPDWSRHR